MRGCLMLLALAHAIVRGTARFMRGIFLGGFVGGSAGRRALSGVWGNRRTHIQSAQGRTNTGCLASRCFGEWGRSSVG